MKERCTISCWRPCRPAGRSVYRTYTIAARIGSDGESSSPSTFTYNRLPVANDDSAIEVILGDTKIIDPKANDSDVVTNGMFISSVGTATYGTVAISGGGQSISYTPIPGAGGVTDSFTYTINKRLWRNRDGHGDDNRDVPPGEPERPPHRRQIRRNRDGGH